VFRVPHIICLQGGRPVCQSGMAPEPFRKVCSQEQKIHITFFVPSRAEGLQTAEHCALGDTQLHLFQGLCCCGEATLNFFLVHGYTVGRSARDYLWGTAVPRSSTEQRSVFPKYDNGHFGEHHIHTGGHMLIYIGVYVCVCECVSLSVSMGTMGLCCLFCHRRTSKQTLGVEEEVHGYDPARDDGGRGAGEDGGGGGRHAEAVGGVVVAAALVVKAIAELSVLERDHVRAV
jgi:hypothetical protein